MLICNPVCFTYAYHLTFIEPYEIGTVISPNVQMSKLSFKDVKDSLVYTQSHGEEAMCN